MFTHLASAALHGWEMTLVFKIPISAKSWVLRWILLDRSGVQIRLLGNSARK